MKQCGEAIKIFFSLFFFDSISSGVNQVKTTQGSKQSKLIKKHATCERHAISIHRVKLVSFALAKKIAVSFDWPHPRKLRGY